MKWYMHIHVFIHILIHVKAYFTLLVVPCYKLVCTILPTLTDDHNNDPKSWKKLFSFFIVQACKPTYCLVLFNLSEIVWWTGSPPSWGQRISLAFERNLEPVKLIELHQKYQLFSKNGNIARNISGCLLSIWQGLAIWFNVQNQNKASPKHPTSCPEVVSL